MAESPNAVTLEVGDRHTAQCESSAAGLDHDSILQFAKLVRRMLASGKSICLIEHNLDFVWQTADRILVLDQGRLIAEGTPDQIRADERVAEIYFGQTRLANA